MEILLSYYVVIIARIIPRREKSPEPMG